MLTFKLFMLKLVKNFKGDQRIKIYALKAGTIIFLSLCGGFLFLFEIGGICLMLNSLSLLDALRVFFGGFMVSLPVSIILTGRGWGISKTFGS